LLERVHGRGLTLSRLTTRHVSLEDVFVAMTGRHVREDAESSAT
jgi:ABC-2 type transport system ATP-binding protein